MPRFIQAKNDFPLTVDLGRKVPDWGLSRWGKVGAVPPLRFKPPVDEGFTLRGDKRQLLYKGRKRSHRFTILGQDRFEYDCILNKEPETNTVVLALDGAEQFDFFRQPDFVHDPFLKGSYAVYQKETLVGEGTGKLCHIHRPRIIDSRGRWVWGDMSIVGDRLTITIPENWLANAKYPVIVDPVVGTSTVGNQTEWYDPDNEDYNEVYVELSLIANRYLISETFNGTAQAYVYAWFDDYDGRCKPVLYSDNNNVPLTRKSALEGNFDIEVSRNKPAGWRSTTLSTNGSIAAGTYIWYALFCDFFCIRFDFGAKCYWEFRGNGGTEIPNTFPVGSPNSYYDFKVSMYFDYTSAQHYTRTLTQGVNLSDTRKLTADYKKTLVMNGQNTTDLGHGSSYYREHSAYVRGMDTVPWLRGFYRTLSETIQIRNPLGYCQDFLRKVLGTAKAYTDTARNAENKRMVLTTGGSNDGITRGRGFFRSVLTVSQSGDTNNSVISLTRKIVEWATALDSPGHLGDYIRGLFVETGNMAETDHAADYYRKQEDTAYSEAIPLRHLFIFIRLVTMGFIRDFILHRFLKSNEEIVLKSPVCREIELDSCL